MPTYLFTIEPPEQAGAVQPSDEQLAAIFAEMEKVNDDIKAAGGWVFAGGLADADSATVLRASGADVVVTDGPFAEGKEQIGGLSIVRAEDLDQALGWATRLARIIGLPIEVRPFLGEHGV